VLELPSTDTVSLIDLPDPCLLAVFQCLADDPASLCSAARAHSRLHQAAAAALRSVTAKVVRQKQVDSVLMYLRKYSHVDSISLQGAPKAPLQLGDSANSVLARFRNPFSSRGRPDKVCLRQMPPNLQLHPLQLDSVAVQLQPGGGFQGVLGCGVAGLTKLQLGSCELLDSGAICLSDGETWGRGPTAAVLGPALLTLPAGLMHLGIGGVGVYIGGLLQKMELDPAILAGKTRLQRQFLHQDILGAFAESAKLLSQLQQMQQLTHLELSTLRATRKSTTLAGTWPAFSALTASSKLQLLKLDGCILPSGAWQHTVLERFPAGRQLPHLRTLSISNVKGSEWAQAASPDGNLLVSCCPGLQFLYMSDLQHSAERLAPLQDLSQLYTLHIAVFGDRTSDGYTAEALGVLCQITELKELRLGCKRDAEFASHGLLLQLSQLKQLTSLCALSPCNGVAPLLNGRFGFSLSSQVSLHSTTSNPSCFLFCQNSCTGCQLVFPSNQPMTASLTMHLLSCCMRARTCCGPFKSSMPGMLCSLSGHWLEAWLRLACGRCSRIECEPCTTACHLLPAMLVASFTPTKAVLLLLLSMPITQLFAVAERCGACLAPAAASSPGPQQPCSGTASRHSTGRVTMPWQPEYGRSSMITGGKHQHVHTTVCRHQPTSRLLQLAH
jgi:hypothetical protein